MNNDLSVSWWAMHDTVASRVAVVVARDSDQISLDSWAAELVRYITGSEHGRRTLISFSIERSAISECRSCPRGMGGRQGGQGLELAGVMIAR